jgi:hypothetical protein
MNEIRNAALSEEEKRAFETVAKVMDRLEVEMPSDVMFDSCDQYYVSCDALAKALREFLG